ncbi:NAD(P)H-hydrate epimerase [Microbacterium esteraromaticum]|uniref:NAD(P)H-hydrate epimerase n=1 Tax=Microbacterium esteraromaticum TaxID=57043 RepID=UPI001CD4FF3A|nr:NAD(P)H-hydrate epimerase [Microbacterium esteraromaticum]MCA1306863.1 NAD(P)H-hydrate epimerase [Microbacterium esteraromaticum]
MTATVPTHTAAQVRAAEAPLLAAGVPLMRRAAAALAAVIAEGHPRRMLVLAGAGDNGGDALFAAAVLAGQGVDVDILCTADRVHDEALDTATRAGARAIALGDLDPDAYDVIVDGILGIGARGALRAAARDVVERLQRASALVVAVDLPSGTDPDTGENDGVVLTAATTVTFGAVKAGLASDAGAQHSGRIVLVDLGLDLSTAEATGTASVSEVRDGTRNELDLPG